ncbi:phosphoenolpyruvate carboxykinase (ATP) [Candidatus Poribacteria bacterium]|nr:phosphoenolpyruvate carboxykinase (ATP) [Candidatus Poribacteria bacterium]
MGKYDFVLEKVKEIIARSKHSATNVTEYMGPSLRIISEVTGQRTKYSGFNWDTRVRSRSAKYTVTVGSEKVTLQNMSKEQNETMDQIDVNLARVFGGCVDEEEFKGHANMLPIDYVHRVMGSGSDPNFTFNCNFLVSSKNPTYHHIGYMWGKMLREVDPIPDAPDLYIIMLPDINTGTFGRFYAFPEIGVTVGLGSDYMGEVKKGFLRMAMYQAKQNGILGVHAASKIIKALDVESEEIKTYGTVIFGLSGTGKTTNVGHTHYLDREGEASLLTQDDFVGLRMSDGSVMGTEQALFLKTDLDDDDLLLKPATKSADFVSQNLYVDAKGGIGYLEEDLCANGRGILPISSLPKNRVYESIDIPPVSELDGLFIFFNTRRNTVVPIIQEIPTPEQAAGYFMLGESIETAAGDPAKAGQSVRVVGTNPFIVGPEGEEGNMFYEFASKFKDKIRCFVMNTGGVGEIRDEKDRSKIIRQPIRPWKNGIGYMSRALFRDTARWADSSDFGTKILVGGVTDEHGMNYDMDSFNPKLIYDNSVRDKMVVELNKERIAYLEKFPTLNPKIIESMKATLRVK